MDRRHFITALAGGAAAALAGCSTDDDSTDQPTTDGSDTGSNDDMNDTNDSEPSDDGSEQVSQSTDDEEPAEADIEITSQAMIEDDYGDAFVGGDLQNVGDAASGYIEVVARFYDEDGDALPGREGVGNHYAYADSVEPGESMVFEIVTWIDYRDVDDYELAVEGGQ